MDHFRIQLVKQSPPVLAAAPIRTTPKLNVSINSITCLNYPIQTLSEVIAAHFDQQPCSANLVLKALKVISISLKDKELRSNFQQILTTNLHKREKIYNIFVLWTSAINNLVQTLQKLQQKLVQNILGVTLAHYCLTKCPYNIHISNLLYNCSTSLPIQSINKISQYAKNEFLTMDYPIDIFLLCPTKLKVTKNNEVFSQFLVSFSNSICKNQQTQIKFRDILSLYFVDQSVRDMVDQFVRFFPNLLQYFITNLSFSINKTQVINVWVNLAQYKMEHAIKAAIKQWIGNKKNLWEAIDHNYNKFRTEKQVTKFQALLQLGSEVGNNILSNLIIKKQLYNFLTNTIPASMQPLTILSAQSQQPLAKLHSTLQLINQLIKSSKNMQTKQNINILMINKIMVPQNWDIVGLGSLENYSNSNICVWVSKIKQIYDNLSRVMNQKGKKIELGFHVVKVGVVGQMGVVRDVFVTVRQLENIFRSGWLPQQLSFVSDYPPFVSEETKIEKKQVHSIVIQAKIVRILKKSKSKLQFSQIYENITKEIDVKEESCRIALDKVISKGFVQSNEEGMYIYCP